MRKPKTPPKNQILKENQLLRLKLMECELKLEQLNTAWQKKFSLLAGIFATEVDNAGTLGELRRWFKEWNEKLDAIDPEDPDADEKMQELFDQYDISLVTSVDPEDMTKQEN